MIFQYSISSMGPVSREELKNFINDSNNYFTGFYRKKNVAYTAFGFFSYKREVYHIEIKPGNIHAN